MLGLRALAVAAVLVCASCATPDPTAEFAAAPPSPLAECARAEAIVYFTDDSPTLQPTTQPLLRDLLARASQCEAAGGSVRAIVVVSHPDSDARGTVRSQQINQRNERVRAALVELGAPADKIQTFRADAHTGEMMARRTEVTLYLN